MECRVMGNINMFSLDWYHRDIYGIVVTVSVKSEHNTNIVQSWFGSLWINESFNESMLGEYWCQVVNTDNTNGISNVVTIHHPECYDMSLSTCSGIQSQKSSKCANVALGSGNLSKTSLCTSIPVSSYIMTLVSSAGTNIEVSTLFITKAYSSLRASVGYQSKFITSSSIGDHHLEINIGSILSFSISTPQSSQETSNGLTHFYIVIIIVSIIVIMLGILLVISCLVILCIKRKKEIEDTTYYGK